MNPAVVIVGSYVQDLAWRGAAFPRPGETVIGAFATGPGGKGSNQAVAAARAGAATGFIGAVGQDAFAQEARRLHRAEGIRSRLAEKPGRATGTAAILVDSSGQNEIVVAPGANLALARADLDTAMIRRARVVVAQLESNLAATAAALRLARRAGAITLLNPAPLRADFDPALLRAVDVVIPNETEFAALLRRRRIAAPPENQLPRLAPAKLHALCRRLGVPTVIVTLAARGVFLSQAHGWTHIPGHRVSVVDTTGAGDAFIGAFAAGLVKFAGDATAAARFGNAAAALSVTRPGTAQAMPRAREIEALLRRTAARR